MTIMKKMANDDYEEDQSTEIIDDSSSPLFCQLTEIILDASTIEYTRRNGSNTMFLPTTKLTIGLDLPTLESGFVILPQKKMTSNVLKMPPEYITKVDVETSTVSAPGRNYHVMHVALRLVCLSASIASVVVMITAKEKSTLSLYGFDLPVYSKWSFSDSFDYLVGVSAASAVHSLLQLLVTSRLLLRKSSIISSKKHAWLLFAADQIFAYAMMSSGSAASGVTNLNRTGIKHSSLPNFCKQLHSFCDRVAVSIAFAFFGCFLLAMSSVLDVVWISEY